MPLYDKKDFSHPQITEGQMNNKLSWFQAKSPHPWHIQLSETHSRDHSVYEQLNSLHTQDVIQPLDKIEFFKSSAIYGIAYLAKMFAGEYDIAEKTDENGKVKQILTRISPAIKANILYDLPKTGDALKNSLKKYGYALIRTGKPINEQCINTLLIGNKPSMDYNRYGTEVRKLIDDSTLVEVTPWAKNVSLPPHNELTHHLTFPQYLSFICKQVAEHGGETTVYDCAKAFEYLPTELQKKFTQQNVIMHKRYVKHPRNTGNPSWAQVLGEQATAADVMAHFSAMGFQCSLHQEMDRGEMIEVVKTCLTKPVVYQYQGKQCLHASILGIAPHWYKEVGLGKTPPLTVTWDDNTPFSVEDFEAMSDALFAARIHYGGWQQHDVLIIDNPRVAHGRLPLIGDRRIGCLLAQPAQFVQAKNAWQVEILH